MMYQLIKCYTSGSRKKNVSDCFQTKTNCTFSFTFGKNYGSIVISNEGKSYESYSNPYAPPC